MGLVVDISSRVSLKSFVHLIDLNGREGERETQLFMERTFQRKLFELPAGNGKQFYNNRNKAGSWSWV